MDRILVGYVRRAHGINGAMVVRPLTDDPEQRWAVGSNVTSDAEPPVGYTVVASSAHPAGVLVQLSGVNDRNAAEALQGTSFTIAPEERRTLDDDEYWPDDLVGCSVVDEHGSPLGIVESVIFGAAQDRLAVCTASGIVEVPMVEAITPTIDIERHTIVATPPPGLFDPE